MVQILQKSVIEILAIVNFNVGKHEKRLRMDLRDKKNSISKRKLYKKLILKKLFQQFLCRH